VPHLAVPGADPAVFGDPAAQRRRRARQVDVLAADLAGGRDRVRRGLTAGLPGDERLHPVQQAQHRRQGLVPGGRVVPVPVQRRFQAGGGQLRRPGLLRQRHDSCGLPPPLQHRDHAQGLAQGVSHQVDRVLHPARAPQRRRIQRRAQRSRPEPLRPRRQVNRALDQPPVQVMFDQPLAEPHQGALGERRILRARAIQDQLPAPAHHRRLDHLIVTDPGVGLQDRCQRQLRRRNRRLALRAVNVGLCQLGLENLVKQLTAILAQEHEQLRPPHRLDHRLFRRRRLNRRPPHHRTHDLPP
jgi:hypothetical protein